MTDPKDPRPLVDQRIKKLIAEHKRLRKETAEKLKTLRESVKIKEEKLIKEQEQK